MVSEKIQGDSLVPRLLPVFRWRNLGTRLTGGASGLHLICFFVFLSVIVHIPSPQATAS